MKISDRWLEKGVVGPVDEVEDQEYSRKHDSGCSVNRFGLYAFEMVEEFTRSIVTLLLGFNAVVVVH